MTSTATLQRPFDAFRAQAIRLSGEAMALVRAHPRGSVAAGALASAGVIALMGAALSAAPMSASGPAAAAPPAPPPLILQQLAPAQAQTINARTPVDAGPNPSAAAFRFQGDSLARAQALNCLTSAVYYEAGNESDAGQRGVAQVVLNRVRHPAFPGSVCGVVYQGSTRETGCQFTFTCDGSLARTPSAAGWARARKVAEAALAGSVYAPVGWATHYHANYVLPYWAPTLAKSAVVGAHLFYRWAGGWGRPPAFAKTYRGQEPNSQFLRTAALSAEAGFAARAPVAVEAAVTAIPGAQPKAAEAGRVAVRFKLAEARKAVEEAPRAEYVETFKASDNLRYLLGTEGKAATEKPLGRTSEATAPAATAAGGAVTASPQ